MKNEPKPNEGNHKTTESRPKVVLTKGTKGKIVAIWMAAFKAIRESKEKTAYLNEAHRKNSEGVMKEISERKLPIPFEKVQEQILRVAGTKNYPVNNPSDHNTDLINKPK